MKLSESFVENIFENYGFDIVKIDEGETKTPDFFISYEHENYLLEVKEKQDSNELKKRLSELQQGEILDISFSLFSNGSIDKIISKAKAQIQAVAGEYDEVFKVVWFHSDAVHSEAYKEQIIASLFGTVHLWDLENEKDVERCYYFNNSKFYRYRNEIDAVFVADDESYQLCLNSFSLNYERIKKSRLVEVFMDGILDPLQEEVEGKAYVANTDIDRADQSKVLEFVETKYKTRFQIFPMNYHSVTSRV